MMGPMSAPPGAYRCGGLCFAVALTFAPVKGAPHLNGTLERDCAVARLVPCTVRLLATLRLA